MRARVAGWMMVAAALLACGCTRRSGPPAPRGEWTEARFATKPFQTFRVPLGPDGGTPTDSVIGARRTYRIREGDTLLDVARWYGLGYNEIVEANPGVDAWLPAVGATVVVPTEWVLPCCTYDGVVVNIPEMRLYQFRRDADRPDVLVVDTYPVGLGRDDRRTPRGAFRIRGKTENPTWVIPESIRREHIRERGDARTSIPAGDPDNPLGRHRLELTLGRYAIHGTNIPWGVGMLVSHGCARLYPEDIARLFPAVAVGSPGAFVYQAVKVGARGGDVFVEVHPDIYRYGGRASAVAAAALRRQRLDGRADGKLVAAALRESRGLPVRVSGPGVAGGRDRGSGAARRAS
jgi:L,D-transpeptidase ErfK/SrfK